MNIVSLAVVSFIFHASFTAGNGQTVIKVLKRPQRPPTSKRIVGVQMHDSLDKRAQVFERLSLLCHLGNHNVLGF